MIAYNDVVAQRDKNNNDIYGHEGSLVTIRTIELNDQPARVLYRYQASMKTLSEAIASRSPNGILSCMQEKSSTAWEICAPATEVSFAGH